MVHAVKHSLIDEKVIKHFIKEYGFSPFSEVQFLTSGLNDTYVVDTNAETFIYRIYRHDWRTKEAIMFELEALLHLHANNLPVSYPLKRIDDHYLCEINAPEGVRYGVLFSYTKGERPQINVDNAQLLGTALGKLHNMTDTFQPQATRDFQLDLNHLVEVPKTFITPILRDYLGEEAVDDFTRIIDNLQEKLSDKELEMGFCHGDFHNHNMHIHNGRIEVFDFDCSGIGYRAYDVAVAWWNLLHNYKNQEPECWDAFLEGYLTQRELSDDDMKSLPAFITIRRIWLIGTMLANDDVWGTNWMTKEAFEIFLLQLRSETVRD